MLCQGRLLAFQSYQSRQINPDDGYFDMSPINKLVSIVSIQTDQSRHSAVSGNMWINKLTCFNRINPDRSIPTFYARCWAERFVSFNRINPDRSIPTFYARCRAERFVSFNRINPDRSIPTIKFAWF